MANEFKIKKGLIVTGASGGTVVDIQGSQGQLFSVTDDLSGSIFAVSDISGVPILDVNSSGLSTFDGTVGIGTSSPGKKLEVKSDITYDGIQISGSSIPTLAIIDTTNNAKLVAYARDSDATIGTETSHALTINTNNTSALTIDTSQNATFTGDVGIGVSPSQPLDVNGTALIRNTIYVGDDIQHWGDGGTGMFFGTDTISLKNDGGSTRLFVKSGGNVGIGTTSPGTYAKLEVSTSQQYRGIVLSNGTNNVGWISGNSASNDNGQLSLSSGGVQKIQINAASNSYFNGGNVGIGTTNPLQPFQVDAGSNIASFRSVGSGQNNKELLIQTGGDRVVLDAKNADDGTATSLSFELGNSEKARLTTTGLGIGTTNPDTSLTIKTGSSAGLAKISSDGNGAVYSANGDVQFYTNNSVYAINFFSANKANNLMRITNSGNVGIGTTSPAVQLELGDNTADEKLRLTGAASGKPLMTFYNTTTKIGQISSSSVGVTVTSLGSGNMTFENGGGARLVIDNSGNVGIADTSPSYKLDVDGTIRATGDVIAYSDIRVKENIKTIDNALEKVNKLRGVEFNKIGSEEKSIGVIAQEIEKILPEVVKEDDKGMKSVAYGNIVGVLIEAIKDQQKQIDELKSIINGGTK